MKKSFKKIFIFLILVVILVFIYAFYIEPERLVINHQQLTIPNWNSELNGLKVAVIADLHIGTMHVNLKKLEQVITLVNQQKPDVIFILGDLDAMSIAYSGIPLEKISNSLSKLNAPKGVFAVLGNHDYVPAATVRPILKSAGINLLKDESIYIYYNNKKIRICGTLDIWHENVDVSKVLGKINEPTIYLSHNPDVFPMVPENVSLTISGHTHGGEISIPLFGAPFVPSVYGQKYTKGYIVENNKHLFVTSGVASLSRMRLFNPPEIALLELYSLNGSETEKTATKLLQRLILPYNKAKFGRIVHCY